MKFDIGQLFLGISKVTVNDLGIVSCEDFYFPTDEYQIQCWFREFKDVSNSKLTQLNENLQEVKKLKTADKIAFTFVDQSNTSYDFAFRDVSLKFAYDCDLVLMTINYNPTKFEIKKENQND